MKRFILPSLISLAIVLVLLSQISLKDLYRLFIKLDPFWGILGAIAYLLALFLRAMRFRWLIHSSQVLLSELFRITVLYHLSLMMLPSKLGELSYPYLLNRWSGLGVTEGLASLITSRVYDFFIILIIVLFILIGFQEIFQMNLPLTIVLAVFFILLTLLVFFYITPLLRWGAQFIEKISRWAGLENRRGVIWMRRKIFEMAEDFYSIRAKRSYVAVSLLSLGAWIAIFFVFYALMRGFGIGLSFFKLLFGSTVAVIANALPISGLGNWGTLEAGWAAGFLIAGLPKEEAISSGFGVHLFIFLVCGITGLFCWISLDQSRKVLKKEGPPASPHGWGGPQNAKEQP